MPAAATPVTPIDRSTHCCGGARAERESATGANATLAIAHVLGRVLGPAEPLGGSYKPDGRKEPSRSHDTPAAAGMKGGYIPIAW